MTRSICVSSCKSLEKDNCNLPRCKYISGNTRKYCKLSSNYKMDKTSCKVTRRIKKKDMKEYARKRIGNVIKSSKMFLNKICPDAGNCMAFGNNIDILTSYFKGFDDFNYATSPIKQIGAVSNNGFINEINYDRNGYTACAVLKSSQDDTADNLLYEYIVGTKYINRISKLFPCFVQTYGLFNFKDHNTWTKFRKNKTNGNILNKSELSNIIKTNKIDYSNGCKSAQYISILIQHIKNASSIGELVDKKNGDFIDNELLYMLFIIYHALSSLSKEFTHYDLHDFNVLLYKLPNNQYVEYRYNYKDGTTDSFFSSYIPKLIDYGRSFFDNGHLKSKDIFNRLCSTSDCKPNCGEHYGFGWLNPKPYLYISSSLKNESHDLRLLNTLRIKLKTMSHNSETFKKLKSLLNNVVYGVGLGEKDKNHGTIENLKIVKKKIYNVTGAFEQLKDIIKDPKVIQENKNVYSTGVKVGNLNIFDDGKPVKYERII